MYKITKSANIISANGSVIPADPANVDYQNYISWVESGNTPEPADLYSVIKPSSVTMRQARLALLQAGHYASVQTAINAIVDPIIRQTSQIEWEYAATVDRDSSFTQGMATALGLTEEDIDNLFMLAASL